MDVPVPPDNQENHDEPDHFAQLTELLLSTNTLDAFLAELVGYAQTQTDHSCSITVRTGDRAPYTVAATDDLTQRLDEQQYDDGRGPCLEALASGIPVWVTDMTTESRWAPYPSHAAELGARSSMSYPLITGEQVIGALNLYAFRRLAPDLALRARAEQLADRAAGALAVGLRLAQEHTENANLRAALTSRSVIDQAIGILVAQQHCTVEDAFALLRQASQGRNIKLREVAAQIVASAQRRAPGQAGRRY
jgi:transcriptional regulator with GAF, ATPase, and Fis domain